MEREIFVRVHPTIGEDRALEVVNALIAQGILSEEDNIRVAGDSSLEADRTGTQVKVEQVFRDGSGFDTAPETYRVVFGE